MSLYSAYDEVSDCAGDCGVDLTQGEPVASGSDGPLAPSIAMQSTQHNVLLFGETGVGKSSVINMLVGKEVAQVSSGATGCTFSSNKYEANVNGKELVLWDTIGLNEGDFGRIPSDEAEHRLETLMRTVEDGVSLLVYVMRATRYREILRINYDLFCRGICKNRVPVVVIVTGLENEQSMDSWWDENKGVLERHGMEFKDKACITTIRGKLMGNGSCMFDEEYDESERKVKELIVQNCASVPVTIGERGDDDWKSGWLGKYIGMGLAHHQGHENTFTSVTDFVLWLVRQFKDCL